MPTKKNRGQGNGGHAPFTLGDAGVGGAHRKKGVTPVQHLFDNIRSGKGEGAFKTITGEHDTKTRVSFGGGKREKPKQTQRLSS